MFLVELVGQLVGLGGTVELDLGVLLVPILVAGLYVALTLRLLAGIRLDDLRLAGVPEREASFFAVLLALADASGQHHRLEVLVGRPLDLPGPQHLLVLAGRHLHRVANTDATAVHQNEGRAVSGQFLNLGALYANAPRFLGPPDWRKDRSAVPVHVRGIHVRGVGFGLRGVPVLWLVDGVAPVVDVAADDVLGEGVGELLQLRGTGLQLPTLRAVVVIRLGVVVAGQVRDFVVGILRVGDDQPLLVALLLDVAPRAHRTLVVVRVKGHTFGGLAVPYLPADTQQVLDVLGELALRKIDPLLVTRLRRRVLVVCEVVRRPGQFPAIVVIRFHIRCVRLRCDIRFRLGFGLRFRRGSVEQGWGVRVGLRRPLRFPVLRCDLGRLLRAAGCVGEPHRQQAFTLIPRGLILAIFLRGAGRARADHFVAHLVGDVALLVRVATPVGVHPRLRVGRIHLGFQHQLGVTALLRIGGPQVPADTGRHVPQRGELARRGIVVVVAPVTSAAADQPPNGTPGATRGRCSKRERGWLRFFEVAAELLVADAAQHQDDEGRLQRLQAVP